MLTGAMPYPHEPVITRVLQDKSPRRLTFERLDMDARDGQHNSYFSDFGSKLDETSNPMELQSYRLCYSVACFFIFGKVLGFGT
ncbi:unnamed protein product [Hydatigera taeniaeformis]|uniref:Uncharacterized protein n=1 Tax=Hydatigena taeniaeformis TaxID=6205 RepID=A0A0R3X2E4_HYDTA|nr:unnamed protein product [Hydatigera taeniaeformis]